MWVWRSGVWAGWRSSVVIGQPATILAWHRRGFQLYWRWRSTANQLGRPRFDVEIRRRIRRGVAVDFVLATSGDKGTADPKLGGTTLASRREREQTAAARLLGAQRVEFLRHRDEGILPRAAQ